MNDVGPLDNALSLTGGQTRTDVADATSNSYDSGKGFKPGGVGLPVVAAVHCTGVDGSSGNETYGFSLQESDDNATWSDVSVEAAADPDVAEQNVLVKGYQTKRYLRLNLDVGGTTPSVTWQAWLQYLMTH